MKRQLNSILSYLPIKNKPIFITGHGRSGTSWIGDIMGQAPGVLYYIEPCNPKVVPYGDYSDWFKYAKPNNRDPYLERTLDPAFKGLITYGSKWLRQPYRRFLPNRRVVIKEVASFMSIRWVYKRYQPDILLVVRHPCAVALSEKKKNTQIDRPIKEILRQTDLIEMHLKPYVNVMKKAKTPFEIYGAVWGARNRVIANLIPNYSEWNAIFYEELIRDPIGYFRKIFDNFNLSLTDKVQKYINMTTNEQKPGTYSTFRVAENQIDKWKREMTSDEIEQVRAFVEPFELPFYRLDSDWSLD